MKNSVTHYDPVARFLHWCTAVLVLVAFIYGPGGPEERVYSSVHAFARQLHETLGLCVLALAALFHHVVLKDDVLTSMLSRRFPVGRAKVGR